MIGDNLFIFEDFTMRTPGELVRLNATPVYVGVGVETYHECAITTDPRVLCRENTAVGTSNLANGAVGQQYFTADMSSVKVGSKVNAMVRGTAGNLRFYLGLVYDGVVHNTLLHATSESHWLMAICTELGTITLRNTLDTQAPEIVEVSLTSEIRQRIRDRDFLIGCWGVAGSQMQCINISEIDLEGNGYPVSRFTGSRFGLEYTRTSKVEGSFDEDPESVVTLHNEAVRYATAPHNNAVGIHKIVAKDKSSSIGKKLMLLEDDGTLVEPNFRDTDTVDRHPQTVWFVEGSKMRSHYKFKLVEDVQ